MVTGVRRVLQDRLGFFDAVGSVQGFQWSERAADDLLGQNGRRLCWASSAALAAGQADALSQSGEMSVVFLL